MKLTQCALLLSRQFAQILKYVATFRYVISRAKHGKRKHNDGLYVLTHKTVFENQNRNSSYLAMFIS